MYIKKNQPDCTEKYPFFQHDKNNPINRQCKKNQPHYSQDEDYIHQNQQ